MPRYGTRDTRNIESKDTGYSYSATTDSLEATRDAITTHDTDIKADIGDFSGQSNLQTLLAALGIPDVSGKPLYTCLITDRLDNATYGLSALEVKLDKKPEWGTAVTSSGTYTDNAGTDTTFATVAVTNSCMISIQLIPGAPANDTAALFVSQKTDGTNYKKLGAISGVAAGVTTWSIFGSDGIASTNLDGSTAFFYADSACDFKIHGNQVGGADGVETAYWRYNILDEV